MDEKKQEQREIKEVSFYEDEFKICEQVNIKGENYFLCFDTLELNKLNYDGAEPMPIKFDDFRYDKDNETRKYIIDHKYGVYLYSMELTKLAYDSNKNIDHIPINDEEIIKKVVLLPSGVTLCTEDQLDTAIEKYIRKWLDVDDSYIYVAIQNIKSYWLYDRFETINYLRALGDTGTGKSRFLNTLGFISYKPILSSGATTVSPIFRMIDKWRGTIIIDEADLKKSDESQDLIKLFNQGYEKNSNIMRCNVNDKSKIDFFNPYCPKIMATRQSFDDKATESRCMTTIMTQTTRKDIPYNLNESFYKDSENIRNMLLYYRFINYHRIDNTFCERPDIKAEMQQYEPRLIQVNTTILNLFSTNEKNLPLFFSYMKNKQKEILQERSDSFDGWIVQVVVDLVLESTNKVNPYPYITSQNICDRLNENEQKVYNKYNSRSIGKHLKTLGFHVSGAKRIEGTIKKIILWEETKQVISIFERYIFDKNQLSKLKEIINNICNIVTNVTCVTGKAEFLESGEKRERGGHVVTHVTNVTRLHTLQQFDDIKLFFEQKKKQENKDLFIAKFGLKIFQKLINDGDVYENPKNHLNLII